MPARQITGKKPKHFWSTFRTLLAYMGRHKFLLLAVAEDLLDAVRQYLGSPEP